MVFTALSAVMVYAPPSGSNSPFNNVVITNTDPIPVDVSGWLHTTKSEVIHSDNFFGVEWIGIDTAGYRQLTIRCYASEDCYFQFQWFVDNPDEFGLPGTTIAAETHFVPDNEVLDVTLEVIGDTLSVNVGIEGAEFADLDACYYMTT